MCVVSNIGDYYGPRFPPWNPGHPYLPDFVPPSKEQEVLKQIKELLEKARRVDAATGDRDCEDPKKTEWMKNVEKRLAELEKINGVA